MSGDTGGSGKKVRRLGGLKEVGSPKPFTGVKQETPSLGVAPNLGASTSMGMAPSLDIKPVLKDKDTTSGGIRKVKFAPKIPAIRRSKQDKKTGEGGANREAEAGGSGAGQEMDNELRHKILLQSRDEAGRVGRTVQWGQDRKPQVGNKNAFSARVALGAAGFSLGVDKDRSDSKKDSGLFGKNQVKLEAEDILEDQSRFYPTVIREPDPNGEDQFLTAAEALHLNCDETEGRISVLQLPSILPASTLRPEGVEDCDGDTSTTAPTDQHPNTPAPGAMPGGGWPNALSGLPAGKIGKLRVYESGAVKLVIGDVQFDVAPGTTVGCAQQLAAVDINKGRAVFLGDIQQRVVVTPDIDYLLNKLETCGP